MANYITLATSVNTRLQPGSSLNECKCSVEVAADEMLAHLLATYRRRRAIRDAVLPEMELGSVPFGVNRQTNTQDEEEEEEDGGRGGAGRGGSGVDLLCI